MKKGYKPSALEYTEIVLLVTCLLMHFVSWVTVTVNGTPVMSFVPFSLFNTSFIVAIFAIYLLTIALKFFGRFTGMTLLIVILLSILVYAAHLVFLQGQDILKYAQGIADLANGLSGWFGSSNTSAVTSGVKGTSMTAVYMIVGVLVGLLVVLLLISWISSACRLAGLPRRELTGGYYMGIAGYFTIGFIAFWVGFLAYDVIDSGASTSKIQDSITIAYAAFVILIMLFMFIVNAVVVGVVELLRERDNGKMMWWSLALAGVCLVIFLIARTAGGDVDYYTLDNVQDALKEEGEELLTLAVLSFISSIAFIAMLTSLLRALYFGVYERKNNNAEAAAIEPEPANIPVQPTADEPATEPVAETATAVEDETHAETAAEPGNSQKWYYIAFAAVVVVAIGLWLYGNGGSGDAQDASGTPSEDADTEVVEAITVDEVHEGVSNYRIYQDEEGMPRLMADLDGTEAFAGVENTFIELIHEQDFDDDGYNEALITESCGGSACIQEVSVVYYDKEARTFKKTNCCESSVNPLLEMWNDRMTIVQRYGIRQDRYIYDNHRLKQVENTVQEPGKPVIRWRCSTIFEDDFEGEREVVADVDCDDADETLVFGHELSHASGFGKYMSLNKIVWSDGRTVGENDDLGIASGESFVILNSSTNGMYDVLVDDTYFFRWNGSRYEEWIWDGRQIVKQH